MLPLLIWLMVLMHTTVFAMEQTARSCMFSIKKVLSHRKAPWMRLDLSRISRRLVLE